MRLIPFREDPLGNLEMFLLLAATPGNAPFGNYDAHDAHRGTGGAAARLHPDRLVEWTQGEDHRDAACLEECLYFRRWPRVKSPKVKPFAN